MSIKNAIKVYPLIALRYHVCSISFNVEKSSFFVFNDIVILEEYRAVLLQGFSSAVRLTVSYIILLVVTCEVYGSSLSVKLKREEFVFLRKNLV